MAFNGLTSLISFLEKRDEIISTFADLLLIDPDDPWVINPYNIYKKCGWSPLDDTALRSRVAHTFVNGNLVFDNGIFDESVKVLALEFDR